MTLYCMRFANWGPTIKIIATPMLEFNKNYVWLFSFQLIKKQWRPQAKDRAFLRTCRQGMEWNGMENEMEWNGNFGKEYGRCQNGMEWKISRMEWKTIFHTSIPIPYKNSCIVFKKNTYRCRVVINNIVTEVFNFNIYEYYLSTNRSTLVVYIAQTVYVLHHCKYIAI